MTRLQLVRHVSGPTRRPPSRASLFLAAALAAILGGCVTVGAIGMGWLQ